MSFSKHIVFKSRMLAVVFLFLNAVCIASPIVKNNADNHNQLISLPLGQNAESEETQLPNSSFINHHAQRSIVLKNLNCNSGFIEKEPILPAQRRPGTITTSGFLPKPGYYIFLFRYTLF